MTRTKASKLKRQQALVLKNAGNSRAPSHSVGSSSGIAGQQSMDTSQSWGPGLPFIGPPSIVMEDGTNAEIQTPMFASRTIIGQNLWAADNTTTLANVTYPNGNTSTSGAQSSAEVTVTPLAGGDQAEFELLSHNTVNSSATSLTHDQHTAPLLTRGALIDIGLNDIVADGQYGVLGQILNIHSKEKIEQLQDGRLYLNTNAPLSTIVCGVQGSGKSHTVSTMLENMFVPNDPRIGRLSKPLCGLVLHLSDGGNDSIPNEAAWLGVSSSSSTQVPKVLVYVSPSSLNTMRRVYAPLGANVEVQPLYFTEEELDAQAFLSMMAVGASDSAPLYVQIILSILRELGEEYTYQAFKYRLDDMRKDFNPAQKAGLKQRLALLESFLYKNKATAAAARARFAAGQLTIVDLSDPFIDPASASGIFDVVVRLFVRAQVDTGKVLLVDEAHKYLNPNSSFGGLTSALVALVREQRHKGMRVIISTQEPTVIPPVLIDLCSVAIMHRFSSPSWWEHLIQHVAADFSSKDAFDRVVKLQTGEALIFAPSGLCTVTSKASGRIVVNLGRRYLHARVRKRITRDGGASVLVV